MKLPPNYDMCASKFEVSGVLQTRRPGRSHGTERCKGTSSTHGPRFTSRKEDPRSPSESEELYLKTNSGSSVQFWHVVFRTHARPPGLSGLGLAGRGISTCLARRRTGPVNRGCRTHRTRVSRSTATTCGGSRSTTTMGRWAPTRAVGLSCF